MRNFFTNKAAKRNAKQSKHVRKVQFSAVDLRHFTRLV